MSASRSVVLTSRAAYSAFGSSVAKPCGNVPQKLVLDTRVPVAGFRYPAAKPLHHRQAVLVMQNRQGGPPVVRARGKQRLLKCDRQLEMVASPLNIPLIHHAPSPVVMNIGDERVTSVEAFLGDFISLFQHWIGLVEVSSCLYASEGRTRRQCGREAIGRCSSSPRCRRPSDTSAGPRRRSFFPRATRPGLPAHCTHGPGLTLSRSIELLAVLFESVLIGRLSAGRLHLCCNSARRW